MNDFEIVKTHKYQKLFITLFVIVVGVLSYSIGYYQFEQNLYKTIGGKNELVKKLYTKTHQVETLENENIRLQQVLSINEKSTLEIKRELMELNSKNDKIVEELMLYKRILDPDAAQLGVVLNKFTFFPVNTINKLNIKTDIANKQLYSVNMVLINHLTNKKSLEITAQCSLIDSNNEINKNYQIFDYELNKIKQLSFKFKHFIKYKVYFLLDKNTHFTQIKCSLNEKNNNFKTFNIEQNIDKDEFDMAEEAVIE